MLILIFILVIKTIIVCFDNKVNCTHEGLPELPDDAIYYPFMNPNSVYSFLFKQREPTRAYVVFGQGNKLFDITAIDEFTEYLKEINFYSPVSDWILFFKTNYVLFSIQTYNFTRVIVNIFGSYDITMGGFFRYDTMMYFFIGARISNPSAVTFYTNGFQNYPITELKYIEDINLDSMSTPFFEIQVNECLNRNYVLQTSIPTVFGYFIPDKPSFWIDIGFVLRFNRHSDFSIPFVIKVINGPFVRVKKLTNIIILYDCEDREIAEDHEVTILLDKSLDEHRFSEAIKFQFMVRCPNIKLRLIRETRNKDVKITFFDDDDSIVFSYPIDQDVLIYNDISMRPVFCSGSDSYFCMLIEDQSDFDKHAKLFSNVEYFQIFIKNNSIFSLNLSLINITREAEFIINGSSRKHSIFDIIDSPTSVCSERDVIGTPLKNVTI